MRCGLLCLTTSWVQTQCNCRLTCWLTQIATHDFIVLTYAQMLRQAGFMTQREVRYSFHDDTNKRPDLIVENYITGRTCFDVSVIHPHSILRGRANLKPGDAARTRGPAKDRKSVV